MKVKYPKKKDLVCFGMLRNGEAFMTYDEGSKKYGPLMVKGFGTCFKKVKGVSEENSPRINCFELENGLFSYVSDDRLVKRVKAEVVCRED
jgi:hypothetical protein